MGVMEKLDDVTAAGAREYLTFVSIRKSTALIF